jgi:hypothetical protein
MSASFCDPIEVSETDYETSETGFVSHSFATNVLLIIGKSGPVPSVNPMPGWLALSPYNNEQSGTAPFLSLSVPISLPTYACYHLCLSESRISRVGCGTQQVV